uniref:Uncharacterized protein n=1 Tax=Romanomermis culicivorax TaxID=13658 RepID=A0A915HW44_ROMCU
MMDGQIAGLCVDDKCMTTLSQDDPLKKGDPNYENSILRDYQQISAKEVIGGWRILPNNPECDFEESVKKKLYIDCDKGINYRVELKVCDSPWPQFSDKFCGKKLYLSNDRLPFHEYQFVIKLCPGRSYAPDLKLNCASRYTPNDVFRQCHERDFKACCFATDEDKTRQFSQGLCFMGLCVLPPSPLNL